MRNINISGGRVVLRALEVEDLDLLYIWENDPSNWEFGDTRVPYSRHQLHQFITSQSQHLGDDGQLRLMVTSVQGESVGVIDIFEYDSFHHRAGVGILIDPAYRRLGYAKDALKSVERYLCESFEIYQLWCGVASDNDASLSLFDSCGYSRVGVKRGWRRRGRVYVDEVFFQKIFL